MHIVKILLSCNIILIITISSIFNHIVIIIIIMIIDYRLLSINHHHHQKLWLDGHINLVSSCCKTFKASPLPLVFIHRFIIIIFTIQLLEYVIPPATAAAPPKSPLCYGVSHVMVLAISWC